jgi:hypothetical protein
MASYNLREPMTKSKSQPKAASRSTSRTNRKSASRMPTQSGSKPAARSSTKHARIIDMLQAPNGATLLPSWLQRNGSRTWWGLSPASFGRSSV